MTVQLPKPRCEERVRSRIVLSTALVLGLIAGCSGAGPYGYDREYVSLSGEDEWMDRAANAVYQDVRRDPADYLSTTLAWFGIVQAVDANSERGRISLTYRTHQPRHLCRDERSSSCRVTVSERSGGAFSIELNMRPEDQNGVDRIGPGSLIKVYGVPTGDFDAEGGPVVSASWYRHWPHGTFVTTGAASSMRR